MLLTQCMAYHSRIEGELFIQEVVKSFCTLIQQLQRGREREEGKWEGGKEEGREEKERGEICYKNLTMSCNHLTICLMIQTMSPSI